MPSHLPPVKAVLQKPGQGGVVGKRRQAVHQVPHGGKAEAQPKPPRGPPVVGDGHDGGGVGGVLL